MTFRKIEERDVAAYTAMATDFYNSPAVLHSIPQASITNTARAVLNGTPYADIYIFEAEGAPVGYGLLALTHSQEAGGLCVWLEEIYLLPAWRGRGIGGAFIEFVKSTLPAARYRLEVEPENARAKALYARHGFGAMGYESYTLDRVL